jgi:RNA polymerase sigma-70 factor (ECF subfamily)
MVYRRCNQIIDDSEKAKELVQDVFLKVWEKFPDTDPEASSSLLWTISTNLSLNYLRDNKKFIKNPDDILSKIAVEDEAEEGILTRIFLGRFFSEQKADSRTMAVLHYVDGLSLEETARETGLSVSGVRKRLRNLRSDLLKAVQS